MDERVKERGVLLGVFFFFVGKNYLGGSSYGDCYEQVPILLFSVSHILS